MERLSNKKHNGVNGNALRTWGLLFVAAGVIGRGVLQTHMLGIGQADTQQILEAIGSSSHAMMLATLSLVLQAMETCAVPIFALLLVQGFQHTSDWQKYLLRLLGLALLSEIPFNLAMGGRLLEFGSRNPVFGCVISVIMLSFYQRYAVGKISNVLIRLAVTAAAVIWCQMLKIDMGAALVLLTAVLWVFRRKALYRNLAGAAMSIVCSLISPFFMAAPMGFLAVHLYNGEKSTTSRMVNYLSYPVLLLAAGVVGLIL